MSKHTPEPWEFHEQSSDVFSPPPLCLQVASCQSKPGCGMIHNKEITDANAQRIVACVNACAGINPKAVQPMLAALQLAERQLVQIHDEGCQNCGVCDRSDCPTTEAIAAVKEAIELAKPEGRG